MRNLAAETNAFFCGRARRVRKPNVFWPQGEQRWAIRRASYVHESELQRSDSAAHFAAQQVRVSDELRCVGSRRPAVDLARRRDLLQFSHAQQGDAVRHDHGFFLVVRHKHERDADFALQGLQLHLHLAAQVGVQRRERFVEQQQLRPVHQRAGQSDALLLAAADV